MLNSKQRYATLQKACVEVNMLVRWEGSRDSAKLSLPRDEWKVTHGLSFPEQPSYLTKQAVEARITDLGAAVQRWKDGNLECDFNSKREELMLPCQYSIEIFWAQTGLGRVFAVERLK
jgi:hypothetical protein